MSEIWKSVVGYENSYEVSNAGNVRRIGKGRGTRHHVLKPRLHPKLGYLYVNLWQNNKGKSQNIHAIVAECFIGPRPTGARYVVNHKDGVRTNNLVDNLEWITHKENIMHGILVLGHKTGKAFKGKENGYAKITDEVVLDIRRMYATKAYTLKQISILFDLAVSSIHRIVRRQSWKHV